MFRWLDAVFFTPPDGDDPPPSAGGGAPDPKGDGKPKDPIDELRSVKDKEIKQVNDRLADVQAELEALKRAGQEDVVVSAVEDAIAKLDPEDPKKALDEALALLRRVTNTHSRRITAHDTDRATAIEQAANYRAAMLVQEHGGDFEAYKGELLKDKGKRGFSLDDMDRVRDSIDLRLQKEALGKPNGNGRRTSVDDGRGSAPSDTLKQEMEAIDTTTPEGQAEWAKKEDEFFKRAKAASGTR